MTDDLSFLFKFSHVVTLWKHSMEYLRNSYHEELNTEASV